MSELEAVGDALTGGVVGRAAEPGAGGPRTMDFKVVIGVRPYA